MGSENKLLNLNPGETISLSFRSIGEACVVWHILERAAMAMDDLPIVRQERVAEQLQSVHYSNDDMWEILIPPALVDASNTFAFTSLKFRPKTMTEQDLRVLVVAERMVENFSASSLDVQFEGTDNFAKVADQFLHLIKPHGH